MISQQQYIENQPVMIYLNWNAFAPAIWTRGTLKTLIERPYMVCSTDQRLERERKWKYLVKVFHERNNYPKYSVKQILDKAFEEQNILVLPYLGKKGDFIIKSMKRRFRNFLLNV